MTNLLHTWKVLFITIGGYIGWLIAEFRPTFPLIIVTVAFIIYDAWTAFQLDRRVHLVYPDKARRHEAKFTSFAFGKVVKKTIPERLILILLSYMAERWVFIHINIPLSHIVTGVILFEQIWSALENNSSCRTEEESRFWRILQKIMVDKSARHFDIDLSDLKNNLTKTTDNVSFEQIEEARKILDELENRKRNEQQ